MPENMPAYGFAGLGLMPDIGVASARTEGGLIVTSRHFDPFWRGQMTTVQLEPWQGNNKHADFLAFLSRCVDLNIRVDFVHPRHRVPSAYTVQTWPMIGDGAIVSVTDLRHVVVGGVNVGITLRRGDRISFAQGNVIVHRWVAAPVTVSSLIAQTIEVTPRLPFGLLAPGAIAVLKDPKLRFMIVPGSWEADEAKEPTAVSFEVMEALS